MLDRRSMIRATISAAALGPITSRAICAPTTSTAWLEGRAMRSDLAIFAEAYSRLHPGLDRYLGQAAFSRLVAQAHAWADRPRLASDWYLALARMTARVRCGHSYPNPVNQSDRRLAMLDQRDRVPFAFRWINGQMIVTRTLRQEAGLKAGTVIDAIDGVGTGDLLHRLIPLARADGGNDAKRIALMEVDGTGRFGAFDVYRPLVGRSRSDGSVVVRADGRLKALPAMTDAERQAAQPKGDGEGWTFGVGSDGIGVLTMPNWALYDSKWDWRGFIDRSIDQLIESRARGLVVDIRDNEGGLDCGDHLLARLVRAPSIGPYYGRFVRYRSAPGSLRPYLDTWDPSFRDWGDRARPSDRPGFFRLVRDADDEPGAAIVPRGERFSGPVAVLISPTCSSATFQFAQFVKQSGVARLVGRPTGGNLRGINGGAYFFLRLPATDMEVDLPLIGYFPDRPQPDSGVTPDIEVSLRRSDIAAGYDRAMARAKAALT